MIGTYLHVPCPKCGDKGGRPHTWTDANGTIHRDWAWCDCPTAQRRIDAHERATWHSTETYGT